MQQTFQNEAPLESSEREYHPTYEISKLNESVKRKIEELPDRTLKIRATEMFWGKEPRSQGAFEALLTNCDYLSMVYNFAYKWRPDLSEQLTPILDAGEPLPTRYFGKAFAETPLFQNYDSFFSTCTAATKKCL